MSTLVRSSDGVEVAVHDLGGTGPALLLSHATGFHGRCFEPLAHELHDRFRSLALDYRGHGDTAQPVGVPIDWERYGDDAEAVTRWLAASTGERLVGVGHSMGGACLLMAAHRAPGLFRGLILFEPIVFPPASEGAAPIESPLVASAQRRRRSFASYEEALANYSSKPPLSLLTTAALTAYVLHGFRRAGDGSVRLKCDPELEAATFSAGSRHRTWERLPEIDVPVLVLSGEVKSMQPSSLARPVAERLPAGEYRLLPGLDHFGPMTHPDVLAAVVAEAAAGWG